MIRGVGAERREMRVKELYEITALRNAEERQ